ncbi:MAG: S9 family peptidase [Flavobacteriales bacterium]|nr:S9 family peptidase [Flavobacteriales bacterium]
MKHLITILFLSLMTTMTSAQESKDLPGNPELPSTPAELQALADLETGDYDYSVEDYFKRPEQSTFRFSPDGKYFSYRQRDEDGKNHIYVKDTETGKTQLAVKEGEDLIRGYGWGNSTRLLYIKDKGGDENYHVYAADVDGGNAIDLTPFDGVKANFSNTLKDQDDHIIVDLNKNNPQIFEPYRLNIRTGEIEQLFKNEDVENPIADFTFDKDGNLRGYTQQFNGTDYRFYYRLSEEAPFEIVKEFNWRDNFAIIDFDYASKNPHDAYVLTDLENDTKEIVRYDLAENKVLEKMFSHETYDAGGMSTSKKRGYEVDYYYYNGEKRTMIPVSETFTSLHKKFSEEFKGKEYQIVNRTDEEDRYLLYVGSDRLYGKYYAYDTEKDEFTLLMHLMPQLKEEDMAVMRPIKFTSRDGLTIHGYLTIPQGASAENKVPMIVKPHGGPYGPRDSWGFNPENQLFASRGYATLQINYRGSGGYGKKFSLAGNKQIGRKMLDDLEDGVAYVKTMGFIDEDRIAIYGGSYGGLATLGSLVNTPELYTCGVDYVGVSNLFTFFKSFPPYWKPYLEQVYEQWYDERDPEDQKIMKQVSPALNVDKITKPLFVIQGANDPRVNIDESDQVVENLRARGYDVPYMVKYDEGHGFGKEHNRIELYECMMGFFAKHLKGGE